MAINLLESEVAGYPPARYSVVGDVLTVEGVAYDLGALADGDTLPREAVPGQWLVEPIRRTGASIRVVVIRPVEPYGEDRPEGHPLMAEGVIDWAQLETAAAQEAAALAELRSSMSVPTYVFATNCMVQGHLTEQQAEDWVRGAALPDFVHEALAPLPTPMARAGARITIWGSGTVHRNDQLVSLFQQNRALTDAQVDALFATNPA